MWGLIFTQLQVKALVHHVPTELSCMVCLTLSTCLMTAISCCDQQCRVLSKTGASQCIQGGAQEARDCKAAGNYARRTRLPQGEDQEATVGKRRTEGCVVKERRQWHGERDVRIKGQRSGRNEVHLRGFVWESRKWAFTKKQHCSGYDCFCEDVACRDAKCTIDSEVISAISANFALLESRVTLVNRCQLSMHFYLFIYL